MNVRDVAQDPRYFTAFDSTKSEIIEPVFDLSTGEVAGAIDVESGTPHALNTDVQRRLEAHSKLIQPLWKH